MSELITTVEALDLISQLGKETVVEYLAENKTIDGIVDDLLALQGLTPAITKGTISNSIKNLTRSIQIDGDSILRALYRLRDTVGGYIEVDNDRQLNWLDSIGEDKGQQIRYRKNLKGIERDINYDELANRIYAYGEGEGDVRIKLSDAEGQEEDYVEDAGSQATWGGVYPKVIIDKTITHPDTLLAWAQLYLEDHKDPPISYRVDTVDLSQSQELDFSFEALQLGSTVKVIDEDLGIDVETNVVKIEHPDLSKPQEMVVELATLVKDITDTLSGVYDIVQLHDHIATKIGAGQVIVLGEFTVIDWVTEGETTIKGDCIKTGSITADKLDVSELSAIAADVGILTAGLLQSSNWGEDAGSEFNLDDGTFRLGGSAAPALSWNGTELTLEGLYEGEWYDKFGVAIDATKGICIYGTEQALITSATKWGTPQCYVGADGKLYAGAGSVYLDNNGLHLLGEHALFYTSASVLRGAIAGYTNSFQITSIGDNIDIVLAATGCVRAPGLGCSLGSSSIPWGKGYFSDRLKGPVGTDCYD